MPTTIRSYCNWYKIVYKNFSDVPDPPISFIAISNTSRTITVKWEPGFNGGLTQTFTLVGKTKDEELFKTIKSGNMKQHISST